jgi:hypothetical protein
MATPLTAIWTTLAINHFSGNPNFTGNMIDTVSNNYFIAVGEYNGSAPKNLVVSDSMGSQSNPHGLIIKSAGNTDGLWRARSVHLAGDVWPFYREGGAPASYRFTVADPAIPPMSGARLFAGYHGLRNFEVEVPPEHGDSCVVTAFVALGSGFSGRSIGEIAGTFQAFVVSQTQTPGGEFSEKVTLSTARNWSFDDSTWFGDVVPMRIDIPVSGIPADRRTVDVRFEYIHRFTTEFYLDPQLIVSGTDEMPCGGGLEPAMAPLQGFAGFAPTVGVLSPMVETLDAMPEAVSVGEGAASAPVTMAAPAVSPVTAETASDKAKFLFVTSTDRYHLAACSHGQTGVPLTVPELIARAAIPCGHCKPPALGESSP